jgi:hypothetical protein
LSSSASTPGSWYGVRAAVTDIVGPAPRKPVIAWLGDSFFSGSNGSQALQCSPFIASRYLGVESVIAGLSAGATGYTVAGTSSIFGASARTSVAAAVAPDLIVFQGSVNDDGQSGIGAAATAAFAAYAAVLPNVPFIVVGAQPTASATTLIANRSSNIAAVKAAAIAHPNVIGFHDMVGTAGGRTLSVGNLPDVRRRNAADE